MIALNSLRSLRPVWLALAVSLLFLARLSPEETARALPANDIADVVFGKNGDFTTSACGAVTATSLCYVGLGGGVAIDSAGNVYINDRPRNRILEYDSPLTTDTAADRVFGQGGSFTDATCNNGGITASSLCDPSDLAVDPAGNLYVVDSANNRVLVYNAPLTTDAVADAVFGQGGNFTSDDCSLTASGLCFNANPGSVAVDASGNVYVADITANRVLQYDAPLTTDTIADRVFGQGGDFESGTCNTGGRSANSLCRPTGVDVDAAGNVYILDSLNNRALEYDSPLTTDTTADRVFGQAGSFVNGNCNQSLPVGRTTLCPSTGNAHGGINADAAGNVYIADYGNSRVLEYDVPLSTDTIADRVYGQSGNMGSTTCALGAGGLCNPSDVETDLNSNLYVLDSTNNRVLVYRDALKPGVPADVVFGQLGSFDTNVCDNGAINASTLCNAGGGGVAIDSSGNVYIADRPRHRVLQYNSPLTTDTTADRVFGQGGSFTSGTCNLGGISAISLCNPIGVAVDGVGNLYVADASNNRVLQYDSPVTTDTAADRVFGQDDIFTSGGCNQNGTADATTLCMSLAGDVTVDSSGNVYIVDYANHRVLQFDTPLTTDTTADRVFGQAGSFMSDTCNTAGITAGSLCFPSGVATDAAGNLYIADANNNRALQYDTPLTTDVVADRVFGQGGSFSAATCNAGGATSSSLCLALGVTRSGSIDVDNAGNVYITDVFNGRLLEYDTPLTGDVTADRVYGHVVQDYGTARCNDGGVSRESLCNPMGIEVDGAGSLFIADSANHRVLVFVAGADVDGDGCSDVEEFRTTPASGGGRDPDNRWDFFDVPVPADGPHGTDGKPTLTPASVKNKAVNLFDVSVVLSYVGRTSTNAGAEYYNGDFNADGQPDGEQLDRTPSSDPGAPWQSGPPNGGISLFDVSVALAQVGHRCDLPP